MSKTYTNADEVHRALNSVNAPETPVYLLEITDPSLNDSIRVLADNDDWPYDSSYEYQAGATVNTNDIVVPAGDYPGAAYTGFYYKALNGGTTDADIANQPAWPTVLGEQVVSNGITWQCEGEQYRAMAFQITLPEQPEEGLGQVTLLVDNVGDELMGYIEASTGGKDSEVTISQALRSTQVIEWSTVMEIKDIKADMQQISGVLAYDDLLNQPAIAMTYQPHNTPNIY